MIILPRWIHVLPMLNVGILHHYHNCFENYYCPVHVQVLYMSHVHESCCKNVERCSQPRPNLVPEKEGPGYEVEM